MTIIFGATQEEASRYSFSLGEDVQVEGTVSDLEEAIRKDLSEQLIIIGPDVKISIATDIAENFRISRPSIGVILLRKRLDISEMSEALRSGIREVINIDDAAALVAGCKRSQKISKQLLQAGTGSQSQIAQGKVLLVFSAKGGCGKTTLAINLAHALSKNPRNRVALLDLDLQFGDVAIALQMDPKKTISDAIGIQNEVDELATRSLLTPKLANLDVLLAPTNPTDVELISAKLVRSLIENLRSGYDYIVIDTPPAFTEIVLEAFDQADRCFLLSTMEMPAIKNLKLVIETLKALNVPSKKLEFVLNRSDMESGLNLFDVEKSLGKRFTTFIPSSNKVSLSINNGVPIVIEDEKDPASGAIIRLAQRVESLFEKSDRQKRITSAESLHEPV
jgi:pilus assembly protein CpaE